MLPDYFVNHVPGLYRPHRSPHDVGLAAGLTPVAADVATEVL